MSGGLLMAGAVVAAGGAVLELARLPGAALPGRLRGRLAPRGRRAARWSAGGAEPHAALLDAAGRTAVPDAAALAVRQRSGALVGGCWLMAAGWLLGFALLPLLLAAAAGAAGGWWLPVPALRSAARRRVRTLADEAPEVLDLLGVGLGCGLPLREALLAAGTWGEGELAAGLLRAAGELGRGAGIAAVLERFAREHPADDVVAAVAIILRAREHGTPAAPALRTLADGARHARARRAVEQAARAAPKIQLVAALLLVPAALCVLAAAVVSGAA